MQHTLRAIVFTVVSGLWSINSQAQWVTINDPQLVSYLSLTNIAQTCMNGNQLDTTCAKLFTHTYLSPTNKGITDLTGIRFFKNATSLDVTGNNLIFLPELPPLLESLDTRNNTNLDSITSFPATLKYAGFYKNKFTHLPALPPNLKELILTLNQLTSLPALPNSLETIVLINNQLTSLPTLPASLRYLDCSNNNLTSLPALPDSMWNLSCSDNPITSLPALPDSLIYLTASEMPLTSLPTLPDSLQWLLVNNDSLTQLPPIPARVTRLQFANNTKMQYNLTSLPAGLTELYCYNSNQTALPPLPDKLSTLYCQNNQISAIDSFPRKLGRIVIGGNPLTFVPTLPDTLYQFSCINTPTLTCLPRLTTISNLSFTNTGVTCLPNYGSISSSNPPLSSLPLCGIFNTNSCPAYWNISGRSYFDSLANCVYGVNDTGLHHAKQMLYTNGVLTQQTLSGGQGFYSFDALNAGNYTVSVDTTGFPFTLTCPSSGSLSSTISGADPFDSLMDFSVQCKPGHDLGVGTIYRSSGRFFPGQFSYVRFSAGDISNYWGANCAKGVSGQVTLTVTGPVVYISSNGPVAPTSVSGNTINWSIADFGNIDFSNAFKLLFKTDSTAQSGQQVCFTVTVNPITGDNNPSNNTLTHCYPVVNSYDPNEKEVYPLGDIDTTQEWLTYTVNFQNTGTAQAYNIYVDDTLDSNIDESSFQLLAYSHEPVIQIRAKLVRFNFPNINLPDSNTNEPASHGYVQYKVKLKDNLPIGTVIKNTAYIYFDFNAPVVTNTTVNTITTNTGIANTSTAAANFTLYPNPSNSSVTISLQESSIGSTLTLTDLTGRVVFKSEIENSKSEINIAGLGSGVYFVTVGGRTQKLIKE